MSASIASGRLSEVLNELSRTELEFIAHDWELWARDDQLAPPHEMSSRPKRSGAPGPRAASADADVSPGSRVSQEGSPGMTTLDASADVPWRVWMLLGGRGSGKTRAGAEWIRSIACGEDTESPAEVGATSPRAAAGSRNASRSAQPKRIALVGKTLADVRNVMVEGVSGLLCVHGRRASRDVQATAFELALEPGDIVSANIGGRSRLLRLTDVSEHGVREIEALSIDPSVYDLIDAPARIAAAPGGADRLTRHRSDGPAEVERHGRCAVRIRGRMQKPWPGSVAIYSSPQDTGYQLRAIASAPATFGVTLDALPSGPKDG